MRAQKFDVERDQQVTMVRKGLPRLHLKKNKKKLVEFLRRSQFEIEIAIVRGDTDISQEGYGLLHKKKIK